MSPSDSALRPTRIIHGILLVSVLLYATLGEKIGPAEAKDLKILPQLFALLAALNVVIALLAHYRMVRPAGDALRLRPDDAESLGRWRAGNLISLVLCESVALFGFVLRLLGGTFLVSAPFYSVAILLLLVWTLRLDDSRAGPAQ